MHPTIRVREDVCGIVSEYHYSKQLPATSKTNCARVTQGDIIEILLLTKYISIKCINNCTIYFITTNKIISEAHASEVS